MEENKVMLKEIIELFVYRTIDDIKSESEVPKVNFLFDEKDIYLFEYVKDYPFKKEGYWTPDIKEEDIKKVKPEENQDKSCPTIVVKDALAFFDILTKIVNSYIHLSAMYGVQQNARALAICVMRRIWLRMGKNDFNQVEEFLEKQLQFIENETFNENRFKRKITELGLYDVFVETELNATYDETTRNMHFIITDKENENYILPSIYYEVDNENTCYIYAVQNKCNKRQSKKIERVLYKLNKNIENPNVHPSRVYAMLLFINFAKEKGITQFKIPKLQVLSYRYHQLLSEKAKIDFEKDWNKNTLNNFKYLPKWSQEMKIEKYEHDKLWYKHVVGKEDAIHKAKTEGLFNLIDRMRYHIPDIEINDNENNDYIDVKLENVKKYKESMR